MKVGLFLGQIGLRGTDQFVYKLAQVCEEDLGHDVIIITRQQQTISEDNTVESQNMFRSRFFVVFKTPYQSLDDIVRLYGLQLVYVSKVGVPDDLIVSTVPSIVHAIFDCFHPHGTVYASISEYMKLKCHAECDVLPFSVELLPKSLDMRQHLGIPADAFVFGRYGGYHQFDVSFAQKAVQSFKDKTVFFLFMNTRPFMQSSSNVMFLPANPDLQARSNFVWACDAMLHARSDGETFGLACGEFSLANKPVLTTNHGDQAHIHILAPNVFVATNEIECQESMKAMVQTLKGASLPRFDAYKRFDREALAFTFAGLITKAVEKRLLHTS